MNETPGTTGKLAAALAAFQAEMPTVAKTHTAKVKTKSGVDFSYTYAALADITEQAMPLLSSHGLAFSACPRATERGYELRGTLLHTSGEYLSGHLPIAGNTPQEMGSSITYMRRYLFGCMTGLVTDDDDDGSLAQKAATRKPAQNAEAAPTRRMSRNQSAPISPPLDPGVEATAGESAPLGSPAESPLLNTSSKLAKAMYAGINEADVEEVDRIAWVSNVIGRDIASTKEMTDDEARTVLAFLDAQKAPVA